MLRSKFLGGVFYLKQSGGFIHKANVRHGSVFIYSVDSGSSVQHTLPEPSFLPHRAGFMWYVLNLGPSNEVRVRADGEISSGILVPCNSFAEVFLLDQLPGQDALGIRYRVKVKELRGQQFPCESMSTIGSPTTISTTGGGSGSPSLSTTFTTCVNSGETESCSTMSMGTLCGILTCTVT